MSPALTPVPSRTADWYVLVHPERFPSNDASAIAEQDDWLGLWPKVSFDDAYGTHISASSAACARRLVVLDDCGIEMLEEESSWADEEGGEAELTVGVPAEGWEVVEASPADLSPVVTAVGEGHPVGQDLVVVVAGFNRWDCVARVVTALRAAGCDVRLDEQATLPLDAEAFNAWTSTFDGLASA